MYHNPSGQRFENRKHAVRDIAHEQLPAVFSKPHRAHSRADWNQPSGAATGELKHAHAAAPAKTHSAELSVR